MMIETYLIPIINDIGSYIKNHYPRITRIEAEDSLKGSLGLDSLDITEMILYFENKYQIFIDGEKSGKIESVQDFAKICHQLSQIGKQ